MRAGDICKRSMKEAVVDYLMALGTFISKNSHNQR
ncbi:hypothetical protein MNBD_NITROSPINAE04-189 [hydrothermal vent metagenome]|uniref:Uncharacterized protein n=1 Tax=hydrothermal vent metagenome TaxID=652676 RepID=A0A3B1CB24_9ZZZZ